MGPDADADFVLVGIGSSDLERAEVTRCVARVGFTGSSRGSSRAGRSGIVAPGVRCGHQMAPTGVCSVCRIRANCERAQRLACGLR